MLGSLPFNRKIFWTVLVAVAVLVVGAWIVTVKAFGYVMQPQDYPGSAISGLIFAYLVHLWLMPEEQPPDDDTSQSSGDSYAESSPNDGEAS